MLSQCLPLWWSEFQHVKAWAAAEFEESATLEDVLLKRLKKCYHPAMSAAYLCDPAFYTYDTDSEAYLANAKQIAEFEAHLRIDVWKDAKQVGDCHNRHCITQTQCTAAILPLQCLVAQGCFRFAGHHENTISWQTSQWQGHH